MLMLLCAAEDSKWMHIILEKFGAMATNVANTNRLQDMGPSPLLESHILGVCQNYGAFMGPA